MEALVRHLVTPLLSHPDDVRVRAVEGESVTILEVAVHAHDRPVLEDEGTLRAVRNIVSAAAGSKKATVELVADDEGGEE